MRQAILRFMNTRKIYSLTVAALFAACSSSQRVGEDADVDADTTQDADHADDADDEADVADDSDVDLDRCPGERYGRTITITNSSSQIEHFDFQHPLTMTQQTSDSWVELLLWTWCMTTCDECEPIFCEPCDPTLRALATGESETYEWDGLISFPDNELECDWNGSNVPCIDRLEAPAGRYRIELCHSPDYITEEEQFGSCHGIEGYVSPASLYSLECVTVEFDYDPCEPGLVAFEL